jgi:Ca2+-binding EF-hand superfamily protein
VSNILIISLGEFLIRYARDKFDSDHSGTISINELTAIMMSTCETNLNQLPEDKRKTVVDLITNLTKEMMASIDRDKNATLDVCKLISGLSLRTLFNL